MDAVTLLKNQLLLVHNALDGHLARITPGQWTADPGPGVNPPGFTLWHVAAIQDWCLNVWIGGSLPQAVVRREWRETGIGSSILAFGMPRDQAFEIARGTSPGQVAGYARAIHQQMLTWLDSLDERSLEHVPDNRAHIGLDPAFASPGYRQEIAGMFEQPTWRLLSGACIGHCRGHLGEVDALLCQLDGRTVSR